MLRWIRIHASMLRTHRFADQSAFDAPYEMLVADLSKNTVHCMVRTISPRVKIVWFSRRMTEY